MSRRAGLVVAGLWAGFGALVLGASWQMDRLERQGVSAWSAPGLTPGLVGLLIVVFALLLALRAWRSTPDGAAPSGAPESPAPHHPGGAADAPEGAADTGAARTALAATLCVAFAGLSLGRGLPFVVEASLFILAFTSAFRWRDWRRCGKLLPSLALTMLIAVVAAAAIGWLFESVFLVRLP